jgi:hypothetical protein
VINGIYVAEFELASGIGRFAALGSVIPLKIRSERSSKSNIQ